MKHLIHAPDDEWSTYIARMWILGSQISKEIVGEKMDGSTTDLRRLQSIIDSNKIPVINTQKLQSLGIVLGKVFVNNTPDYDWWVVEDEYGKDACVRYKQTSLLIFPQTMISKRVEDGEEIDVSEFYIDLKEDLEQIKNKNYPNA